MGLSMTELNQKNEKYFGSDAILSVSSLTYPSHTDASRLQMFTRVKDQALVILEPNKPMIFTNYEDMYGDRSSHIKRAKGKYHVTKIIRKFSKIKDCGVQPYLMFVYNETTDSYDVLERKEVEKLSEKYGFELDNHVIDHLKEGDEVSEGTTLFSPTCYDKYGNYGYGRNVPFLFLSTPETLEDAIDVTHMTRSQFTSTEVDRIPVSINENNILSNHMGDKDHYKCFPDVGEFIKDKTVCVRKILNRAQILFDMKEPNTRREMSSDTPFFNDGQIVDIDIYCNKPRKDIPDTTFNHQILEYLDMVTEYHTQVYEYTSSLINSGQAVSRRILELHRKSFEYLNDDYIFKDENNSPFSNIMIYFTVKRRVGLLRGQKLTGRYGNKGVIGNIRDDSDAYYLEDGTQVQVIFDALSTFNRLIIFQIYEYAITFRARRVLERIRVSRTLKEKEKLLFDFIEVFDPEEASKLHIAYKELPSTKDRQKFFQITEENGIYIHVAPFWRNKSMYDCVRECDVKFPWIEPYEVFFFDKGSNRWVRQMTKQPVGYMYVMKLKQSSKKGLSVRSTGSVGKRGVPEKSNEAKQFKVIWSKIPVRLGVQENQCQLVSLDPELIAKESITARTSPVGRRTLMTKQLTESGGVDEFKLTSKMKNRNIEIFQAYLRYLGMECRFEEDVLDFSEGDQVKTHFYKNHRYFCTTEQMRRVVAIDEAKRRLSSAEEEGPIFIGLESDKEAFTEAWAEKIAPAVELYIK